MANILVFIAMLMGGAGFWHSPNGVQLAWGANFGPATQDGEWWRLASAMFLHFGIVHLVVNVWSLWDAGQLVERMYGQVRFISIYFISGLSGNLLSLVIHGNLAVSGGASGAIFGVYAALLTFLWRERATLVSHEFRWLFWGASVFAFATIMLGFMVSGIDNAAHIGGFITGLLTSLLLAKSFVTNTVPIRTTLSVACLMGLVFVVMITHIPAPKYRWSDEIRVRKEIDQFLNQDQAINRSWLEIIYKGKQGTTTFDQLAGQIDNTISEPYEASFEKLSQLPANPALPSAAKLETILKYVRQRKNESHVLADKLRSQNSSNLIQQNSGTNIP